MMTPDDARRLVKNRNEREYRAQQALDRREEEELDFLEEAIAIYLAESDFTEYVTNMIDAALANAIDLHKRLVVGFHNGISAQEDFIAEVPFGPNNPGRTVYACYIDPKMCEIEAAPSELAWIFCETVHALYEDTGWDVGEIEQSAFWLSADEVGYLNRQKDVVCFEIFY